VLDHRRRHALAAGVDKPQVGGDWQLEEVRPQKPRREEQYLEIFKLIGARSYLNLSIRVLLL